MKREFLMAINITAKGDPEKKLKWAFKMYDVDGNGEIDKGEMLQIIQVLHIFCFLCFRSNFSIFQDLEVRFIFQYVSQLVNIYKAS